MNKTVVYALFILLIEVAGFTVGMLTREGTRIYAETIQKPPLSPPGIVFPVAWMILYALMGIGVARVIMAELGSIRTVGIALFATQLILNLAWSFIFFGAQRFDLALVELIAMLVTVIVMTVFFNKCDVIAARIQIPYIIWLCFATYLNAGVLVLNGAVM